MNTRQIGDIGEDYAEKYLKKRFWKILSRNYKAPGGEIDIIGYRFGVLVYFEVKARSNNDFGQPSDAVDGAKVERIKRTARHFLNTYRRKGRIPVFYPFGIERLGKIRKERIDVIEVFLTEDKTPMGINHIKDWGKLL